MRIMKSEEVTSALERAAQLAERLRGLSEDERKARFFENLEKIRAEAIEKGIAIDDERALGSVIFDSKAQIGGWHWEGNRVY